MLPRPRFPVTLNQTALTVARIGPEACVALSVAAGVVAFFLLELASWHLAGGFEYPLDDVYIHLRMAEGIASGTYGINPGEPSSASSSALWPLLLVPLAAVSEGRYLPFALNLLSLIAVCALWGWGVARAALPSAITVIMAVAGPVALNTYGVAALGMEHMLQTALVLAMVLGLGLFIEDGRLRWWLGAAIVLSPLVRFEDLALALLASAAIALRGRVAAGILTGGLAIGGVGLFSAFLVSQGLDWLPASVRVKTAVPAGLSIPEVLYVLIFNLLKPAGLCALALSLLMLVMPLTAPTLRRDGRWLPFVAAGLMGLAHLSFGRFGWGNRYEHYLFVAQAGTALLALRWRGTDGARIVTTSCIAALILLPVAVVDFHKTWTDVRVSARAVALQQGQMARFVHDDWQRPVAVNDLGYVSWRDTRYVLDLWGLGSPDALRARLAPDRTAFWAQDMTRAHGVDLAMIYRAWYGDGFGADWVLVGTLTLAGDAGLVGGKEVSFYATSPDKVSEILAALDRFTPTLPEGASFDYAPGMR